MAVICSCWTSIACLHSCCGARHICRQTSGAPSIVCLSAPLDAATGRLRRLGGRDVKLSKKERAELDYKKEVLRLAKEKRKYLEDIEDKDVYHMPESYDAEGTNHHDKRMELLTSRYK